MPTERDAELQDLKKEVQRLRRVITKIRQVCRASRDTVALQIYTMTIDGLIDERRK